MKKQVVLILDFGTSNVRGAFVDRYSGEILGKESLKNQWIQTIEGYSEMDPIELWNSAQYVVERMVKQSKEYEILGLSFSFFGDSLILTDSNFEPLSNMVMAFDTRASEEAKYLENKLGREKFIKIVGGPSLSMLVCSKILWFKNHKRELFDCTSYFLNIQEFLLAKLGLGMFSDYTLANRKTMLDIETKDWSKDLIDLLGISKSQLGSTIADSTYVLGKIKCFGKVKLPYEIPVVLGAHDSECGTLGLGVNPENPEMIGNVSGTYEMLGYFSENEIFSIEDYVVEKGCGLRKKQWIINGSSIAGSYVTWFQKELSKDKEGFFGEMESKVNYDGKDSILFIPGNDQEKCKLIGFDAFTKNEKLYQAMIEGITFKLKSIYDEMERLEGRKFKGIVAGGGGSSSDKWLQFKADLFGKKVYRLKNQEVSALGAAIIALVGLNVYSSFSEAISSMIKYERCFEPNDIIHNLYMKKYQKYLEQKI